MEMGLTKFLLAFYFIGFHCVSSSLARSNNNDHKVYFMHELNRARAKVGVPPLIWNISLKAYPRRYANRRVSNCKLVYSHGPYGECIVESYGGGNSADAIRLWIVERVFYNHKSNNYSSECWSYTQVV
jgi:pathogenesis-related protein 1